MCRIAFILLLFPIFIPVSGCLKHMTTKLQSVQTKDQSAFLHSNTEEAGEVFLTLKYKREIRKCFPPQNDDDLIVWLWIDSYEDFANENEEKSWMKMVEYNESKLKSGWFLLFKGDEVLVMWSLSSNTPDELLGNEKWCEYMGLDTKQ